MIITKEKRFRRKEIKKRGFFKNRGKKELESCKQLHFDIDSAYNYNASR